MVSENCGGLSMWYSCSRLGSHLFLHAGALVGGLVVSLMRAHEQKSAPAKEEKAMEEHFYATLRYAFSLV